MISPVFCCFLLVAVGSVSCRLLGLGGTRPHFPPDVPPYVDFPHGGLLRDAESPSTPESEVNVKAEQLVHKVQALVTKAKQGMFLDELRDDIHLLQQDAGKLYLKTKGQASSEEISAVIHSITQGIGSGDILTFILADSSLDVLSGRLILSLEYMERAASLLLGKLSSSSEVVEPYFAALVVATEGAASIITQASVAIVGVAEGSASLDMDYGWSKKDGRVFWVNTERAYTTSIQVKTEERTRRDADVTIRITIVVKEQQPTDMLEMQDHLAVATDF